MRQKEKKQEREQKKKIKTKEKIRPAAPFSHLKKEKDFF